MTASEIPSQESDVTKGKSDTFREWRRAKVWELRATGCSVDDIVDLLKDNRPDVKISHGTVYNDLKAKQEQIAESFEHYIEDLPLQHHLSRTHLDMIKKQAWRLYYKSKDEKVQVQALNTAMNAEGEINKLLGDPEHISKLLRTQAKLRNHVIKEEADVT